MRVLTVPEFYNWAEEKTPAYYVISTYNNPSQNMLGFHISMRLKSMIPSASLDRICFRDVPGTICLENVKEVYMYDDEESIGTVFDVVCGLNHNEEIWRVIAD